jgi:hypothetical protein
MQQHPFPNWILIILLFLTPFIGLFDVVFGSVAFSSVFVGALGETNGVILVSRVDSGTDSDGDTTYSAHITYRYTVDGTAYEGTGMGFGDWTMSGSSRSGTSEEVDAHPAGTSHTIYYEESDPQNSALSPESEPIWAVPLLLLTPFNMALLILWSAAINIVRRRWWIARQLERPDVESAPPGCDLLSDGGYLRLRASNVSPLLAGLIGAGVTGFLCTFAGAALVLVAGVGAQPILIGFVALLVIGAGLPWYFRKRRLDSGVYDLVIDPKARSFAWDGGDPSGPNARAFDAVRRVEVEKKVISSRSSDGSNSTKTDYVVRVDETSGGGTAIYTFSNEPTKADAVALWLRTVLGLRTL